MGLMTQSCLDSLISKGYGAGRDENYSSWIRVRRRTSSPVSNLHRFQTHMYERPIHLLSGLEHSAANVALWLGCGEIREQHPLWPQEHAHPSTGRNPALDGRIPLAPGLISLAKEAGIKHGVYPGTCLPFVATIDFTLACGPGATRLVHWSCKPRALLNSAPNRERMRERIHLESLYSAATAIKHVVIDGTHFTGNLVGNLDWFRPLRSEWINSNLYGRVEEYASHFMSAADDAIRSAKKHAAETMGLNSRASDAIFGMAIWKGDIDIDLFEPVVMTRPIKRDVAKRKLKMSLQLLGEDCV